jgi:signal transduction histidine kinase
MIERTQTNRDLPNSTIASTAVDLERRLAFLELTSDDRMRLGQLAPMASKSAGEFVAGFYAHLLSFPDTARFLADPALVARLKSAQQSHLETMLQATWDQEYVLRRRRVGDAHAQVGVSPEIFLGAYMQYFKHLLGDLNSGQSPEVKQVLDQILSLVKVVFLDIGLTLDAYFDQAIQNLRRAMEMVVNANAELRQFAHFTSHDLKTPLATVANLCDETLDEFRGEMPEEAAKLVEAARNRVFRMSATIDDLLATAARTTEAGSLEQFSARELIDDLVDELRPRLLQKEIEVSLPRDLPKIVGDRVRIREAVYNVLANAVKFIDKRPGRIVVETERNENEFILVFADNGPGIPREDLNRIFMPFFRLHGTGEPGSGLGLYFTKSLIERQGGRVWAESVLEEGSRFFIALPYSPDEQAAE